MKRHMILWVSYEMLREALLSTREWRKTQAHGVPEDAELIGVWADETTGRVGLKFSHPSFREVSEGHSLTALDPISFRTIDLS